MAAVCAWETNHRLYPRLVPSLEWLQGPSKSCTSCKTFRLCIENWSGVSILTKPWLLLSLVTAMANQIFNYTAIMSTLIFTYIEDELVNCDLTNVYGGGLPQISGELEVNFSAKCEGLFAWSLCCVEIQSFSWSLYSGPSEIQGTGRTTFYNQGEKCWNTRAYLAEIFPAPHFQCWSTLYWHGRNCWEQHWDKGGVKGEFYFETRVWDYDSILMDKELHFSAVIGRMELNKERRSNDFLPRL